jgi:hypothetical protein
VALAGQPGDGAQGVAASLVVDEPGGEQGVEGSAEQVGVLVAQAGAGVDAVDEQAGRVCRSRRARRSTPPALGRRRGPGDEHVQGGGGAGEGEPLPGPPRWRVVTGRQWQQGRDVPGAIRPW